MKNQRKNWALIFLIVLVFFYVFYYISQIKQPSIDELPYSSFLKKVRRGGVKKVTINDVHINGVYKNNKFLLQILN